ncbi:DUF7594 domain-containing protein [Rubellicoccus peritrichatus]|uniref:Family 16 glycosylhydrolase n=1 Tax=Rubellicoccus peritrichatus TaxID=3080537 RepID=A0AAQ3QUM6_9BACT|nr:DNRLRE domain-containing protein [Puniceicoccus sp. CR14]WOO40095.1 family 16 glycosylhydrolase [Puniceicoccus sp. CR14]
MFRSLLNFLFLCCGILAAAPPPGSWELVFEEEFSSNELDGAVWKLGLADAGIEGVGGTTPESISLAEGVLTITALNESAVFCSKEFPFSTAEISTFLRYNQKYGYFEARMRWDTETGMWPAFWLMPQRNQHGIQEYYNRSYLKFDISEVDKQPIESAKLRLKVIAVGNDAKQPNNIQAFAVTDDSWSEDTLTWNNQPLWNPLYLDQKFGYDAEPASYVELDVTDFVNAELAGDGIISIALADEFRRARGQFFHSKEATNAEDQPQLVLDGVVLHPTDDAMVIWGKNADKNTGKSKELRVRTHYHNATDDTANGGMEIDIMETLGVWGPTVASHALHWDGYGSDHKAAGWGPVPVGKTDEFHDYGVYWAPGLIEFYIDGVKTGSYASDRVMNTPAYLILSLQLGGWDGNRPTEAIDGNKLDVDYVRAWSGTKIANVPSRTTQASNGVVSFGKDYTVYGGKGNAGSQIGVADDGSSFSISRNGWMKFPLDYTVTPDTILEFSVKSSSLGEILGIGLDEDDDSANAKRVFQLAGSQTWKDAWQDFNDYPGEAEVKKYTIPVGEYYTGPMSQLVITADNDTTKKIYALFGAVRVYEK